MKKSQRTQVSEVMIRLAADQAVAFELRKVADRVALHEWSEVILTQSIGERQKMQEVIETFREFEPDGTFTLRLDCRL